MAVININNPRKEFQFRLEFPGLPLNQWLVQEVSIPSTEIDVVAHGDANFDVNTGGRVKFGKVPLKKIMTTDGGDNFFYNWITSVQDAYTGGGMIPTDYKKTIIITELAEDGASPLNKWQLEGAWPSSIGEMNLTRKGSENTIEDVTLTVDRIFKI